MRKVEKHQPFLTLCCFCFHSQIDPWSKQGRQQTTREFPPNMGWDDHRSHTHEWFDQEPLYGLASFLLGGIVLVVVVMVHTRDSVVVVTPKVGAIHPPPKQCDKRARRSGDSTTNKKQIHELRHSDCDEQNHSTTQPPRATRVPTRPNIHTMWVARLR